MILILSALSDRTPRNLTLTCAILSGGLYALLLYLTRKWWLPFLSGHPLRNAILLGIFNAAFIETIFWAWEKIWGASGVAMSPDLARDLFMTMPWYIGMVIIFVWAQSRRRFSTPAVLLLGGLYELGADGFLGGMVFGGGLLSPGAWALLALAYWEFIMVYASMVMPPALLVDTTPRPPEQAYPAWADGLAPLLWLVPYTIFLVALFALL
jgi:hypothetical protein